MSKSNKKSVLAVLFLVVVFAACACFWYCNLPATTAGSKDVTVEVIHSDGNSTETLIHTDETYLGPVLISSGIVEDNQTQYGLYIITADGETVDETNQEWWMITKEGEPVNTGADSTPIEDGDHFELILVIGW